MGRVNNSGLICMSVRDLLNKEFRELIASGELDEALYNIGTTLLVAGLVSCLVFLYHIIPDNKKRVKFEFSFMLISFALGLIGQYYRLFIAILLGLGALCILVLGLLLVSLSAFGLFEIIKGIVSLSKSLLQERRQARYKNRATVPKNKATKHRKTKPRRQRTKQSSIITSDIPDETFFEVQLPPGGLE